MQIGRRYLFRLAGLAVLAPVARVLAQGGFDLGRVWQVREYEPDGSVWEGTWTRRGNSPVFDALWRNSYSGGVASDVIEFRGVQNGSAVLFRYQQNGTYYGPISGDGTRIRRGTASWYQPGNFWEAQIHG